GDPMRGMPPLIGNLSAHFHTINQGKEVVELDLHSPKGKADFRALIQSADVFFHNWGPGRAERLGLTQEKVNQIAPHLIYASASGSGNPPTPSAPIGTDFMIQAYAGVAANISNPNKTGGALITMIDTLGAAAAAEGIVSALFRRFKDGSVNAIDSSMLGAGSLLIDAKRTADAMNPPANQKAILDINQTLNLPNTFATQDGTLFIEAVRTTHQAEVLQGVLDKAQRTSPSSFSLHTLFTSHNTTFWEEQFAQQQIPSSQVNQNAQDILHHPVMKQHVSVNHDTLNFLFPWTYSKGEQ
uniref:CoA transferase n=1 Tax=Terasakiella pusilla TaxID=64973 RepID=UPI003AA84859